MRAMNPAPIAMARIPARRARAGLPAPMAWPTATGGCGGDSQRNHIGVGGAAEDDFVRGKRDGCEVCGHDGDRAEGCDFEDDL